MTVIRYITSLFSIMNAAIEAASAARQHRLPNAKSLATLGISKDQFRTINL